MTPSRARKPFLKASPYVIFTTFVWTEYGYDGDRFNAARLFHVLSEESAKKKKSQLKNIYIHSMNLLNFFKKAPTDAPTRTTLW